MVIQDRNEMVNKVIQSVVLNTEQLESLAREDFTNRHGLVQKDLEMKRKAGGRLPRKKLDSKSNKDKCMVTGDNNEI